MEIKRKFKELLEFPRPKNRWLEDVKEDLRNIEDNKIKKIIL